MIKTSLTQTILQRPPAGRGSHCRAPLWGYLELHPIASVDCHVVRALQEVVEGQRWVITGVDVPFRIGETHTAESWRKALSLGHGEQLRCHLSDGLRAGTEPLGTPVFSCPHSSHCCSFSFSSRINMIIKQQHLTQNDNLLHAARHLISLQR